MATSVLAYKFCSEPVGLMNLAMRRVRGAVMNSQNDPFEMEAYDCPDAQREVLQGMIDNHCDKWRSISLCLDTSSPVTWAHYADSHKGICLAVRVTASLLIPARYVEKRQFIDLLTLLDLPDSERKKALLPMMCTKSADWQYENETRLIFTVVEPLEGGYSYVAFAEGFQVEQVIMGARCPTSPTAMRNALDRMGYANVKLLKADKSPDFFKMTCAPAVL